MSRVRVPQEQLGTGPLSVLSTPLPPINTPTVAGQLAGILSGGADVATRAVGFMAATQQMKNQEAILSIRNNEAAVREAEQNARQLEADEARNASIMRGEASLAFDEVSGSIQEAFASGQMDAHIGRVPDAEALAAIADGFADPATAGFGADSEYTKQFKREARALVTRLGLSRQVQLQEIDKQSNITAIQRDLMGVTTPEEVNDIFEQTKDTLGMTKPEWVEKVLTPAIVVRSDENALGIAKAFIDDPRHLSSVTNRVQAGIQQNKNAAADSIFGSARAIINSAKAMGDVAGLTEQKNTLASYAAQTPEHAKEAYTLINSIDSAVNEYKEQAQKQWDEAVAQNQYRAAFNTAASKVASGRWWEAEKINVKVGGVSLQSNVEEVRDAVYRQSVASIDANPRLAPDQKERSKMEVAFDQKYAPPEYKNLISAGAQDMQALGRPGTSAQRTLSKASEQAVAAYRQAQSISPEFAAQLVPDGSTRAMLDSVIYWQNQNGTGSLADAVLAVNTSNQSLSEHVPGNIFDAKLNAAVNDIVDSDAARVEFGAEAREYVKHRMRAGTPLEQALKDWQQNAKPTVKVVNGKEVKVHKPDWVPPDKEFSLQVGAWFDEVAGKIGKQNIKGNKPLTANDLTLRQDRNSGLWTVIDTRTNQVPRINGADDLKLVSFSTRDLVKQSAKSYLFNVSTEQQKRQKILESMDPTGAGMAP